MRGYARLVERGRVACGQSSPVGRPVGNDAPLRRGDFQDESRHEGNQKASVQPENGLCAMIVDCRYRTEGRAGWIDDSAADEIRPVVLVRTGSREIRALHEHFDALQRERLLPGDLWRDRGDEETGVLLRSLDGNLCRQLKGKLPSRLQTRLPRTGSAGLRGVQPPLADVIQYRGVDAGIRLDLQRTLHAEGAPDDADGNPVSLIRLGPVTGGRAGLRLA